MRKIPVIVGIFSLMVPFAYKGFFYMENKTEQKQVTKDISQCRMTTDEMEKLQEGDIVLRHGYGFLSDYISKNFGGKYKVSHAGVLSKEKCRWWVIHSLSDNVSYENGVQRERLEDFLKKSKPLSVVVSRLKGVEMEKRREISQRAYHYLNKKIPFDSSANVKDCQEMFCSELIWQIIGEDLKLIALPKDIKEREKLYYNMGNLYDSQCFEIVTKAK